MTTNPRDHVERDIVIKAPVERVFAALTDPACWPSWGPERMEGRFAPGERPLLDFGASGKARVYVVAIEPPRYFAYRWIQGQTDPEVVTGDPLAHPNTLVEFFVEATGEGTRVRVVESGISKLPGMEAVEDQALDPMREGWRLMLGALQRAVEGGALEVGDRIDNQIVVRGAPELVFAKLANPVGWWAQSIDSAIEPGTDAVLDFGPFGRIAIHTVSVEAPRYLAFRWVQGGDDPVQRLGDARGPASTLVEFELEPADQGTRIKQSESGFEALPVDDLAPHYGRAHQAWGIILGLLEGHLAKQ